MAATTQIKPSARGSSSATQPAQRSLRVHTPRRRDVRDKHEEDLPITTHPASEWPTARLGPAARGSPSGSGQEHVRPKIKSH
jgi:hypothetical protein